MSKNDYLKLIQQVDSCDSKIRYLNKLRENIFIKIANLRELQIEKHQKYIGRRAKCIGEDRDYVFEAKCTYVDCINDLDIRYVFSNKDKRIRVESFEWID